LLSNADFWLSECHIDGLRVDAVASMLYLDYSRKEGEWVPNMHGGRENLEAVSFLQTLNSLMYGRHPGIMMIAEESTAWPGVSHPVDSGGLGFGYKWNMGWMNDTLRYISKDPIHRSYHHDDMTFGMVYARDENFILSISHDECVHGKGSLLNKMPGDDWQKRANLRAYWGYMWAHPGKKLLFMGMEFGQYREWDHDHGLDWHLLDQAEHRALVTYLAELNRLYSRFPSLYQADQEASGFQWLQSSNRDQSIYAWVRSSDAGKDVIAVFNATPTVHHGYRLGVPSLCDYEVILNSDETQFGGSGVDVTPSTEGVAWDDCAQSLVLTLPPLATIWLVPK
jgi:1,4-alpha-glucan branching enzyme